VKKLVRTTVVLATTTALVTAGAVSAQAGPKRPSSGDVASGLVGPLGLAVGSEGTIYVAESFAGQLTAIDRKGRQDVLVAGRGSINGVDARGKGTVVFVASAPGGDPSAPPQGQPSPLSSGCCRTARRAWWRGSTTTRPASTRTR
jgi:hypothetical protein